MIILSHHEVNTLSLSSIVMSVTLFSSTTSDVESVRVKAWSPSNAASSSIVMLTQPRVWAVDPEGKVMSDEDNVKSELSIAKRKCLFLLINNWQSIYTPVPFSMVNVIVNFVSVCSISVTDSEVHTSTIPASSLTSNMAGTDTLTSNGNIIQKIILSC